MNFLTGNSDYIDIHSHKPYPEAGIFRVFNQFPGESYENKISLYMSVGLHPWYIDNYPETDKTFEDLYRISRNDKIIFIGETGLDKYREKDLGHQMEIFIRHIHLSEELQKPLIIHCVRAFEELLKIKRESSPIQPWIIHGYDSSPEMAASLVGHGIFLSVGERLLKKTHKSKKILQAIPLSKLFIETDDGKTTIPELYKEVAEIYRIDVKDLKEYIIGNFNSLFHE
jgi:TatD DNase family protein